MISEYRFGLKKDGEPKCNCFCRTPELIENYDKAIADKTQTWECHHRLETHNSDGERRIADITSEELITLNMYYDRPPEELIFLTHKQHRSLHWKGKPSPMKGKPRGRFSEVLRSEEWSRKISESLKGKKRGPFSEEHKRKIAENHKGKHWYNNGKDNKFCYECPEGFVPGMLIHK